MGINNNTTEQCQIAIRQTKGEVEYNLAPILAIKGGDTICYV
jgi:hypothetical protein